jgi:hypothetical protein
MLRDEMRRALWRELGAEGGVVDELMHYADAPAPTAALPEQWPLADEPFVAAWERYAREAERDGAADVLRRAFIQTHFPIAAGISGDTAYQAATRRGLTPMRVATAPMAFVDPEGIRIFLHQTPAGRIPVIACTARGDFEALVRALSARNEPEPIPPAMGACIIAGYINWERFARERAASGAAFAEIAAKKELYLDRFILLSAGDYSAVPAAALGMDDGTWRAMSLTIRLNHEATHYFTRRAFHSMRNNLLDELVADYVGIVAATGRYRVEWFARFMGVEDHPRFRPGGRLERYRGTPALSDDAFDVLQRALIAAAAAVDAIDRESPLALDDPAAAARRISELTAMGLERLVEAGISDRSRIAHAPA